MNKKKVPRCIICQNLGSNPEHPKKHCKYVGMLQEIAKNNNVIIDVNSKCRICNKIGHKSIECINLQALKNKLNDVNHI